MSIVLKVQPAKVESTLFWGMFATHNHQYRLGFPWKWKIPLNGIQGHSFSFNLTRDIDRLEATIAAMCWHWQNHAHSLTHGKMPVFPHTTWPVCILAGFCRTIGTDLDETRRLNPHLMGLGCIRATLSKWNGANFSSFFTTPCYSYGTKIDFPFPPDFPRISTPKSVPHFISTPIPPTGANSRPNYPFSPISKKILVFHHRPCLAYGTWNTQFPTNFDPRNRLQPVSWRLIEFLRNSTSISHVLA